MAAGTAAFYRRAGMPWSAKIRLMSAVARPSLPRRLANLVRLEHSLFALPYAVVGALLAADGLPPIVELIWVGIAMVAARTLATSAARMQVCAVSLSVRRARVPRSSILFLLVRDRNHVIFLIFVRARPPASSPRT
jgi:hypothetical protein